MRRAICWLVGCDIVEIGGDWQAECNCCGEVQHYLESDEPLSVYYANVAVRAKDKFLEWYHAIMFRLGIEGTPEDQRGTSNT